jgi:hypothetical protein
MVSRSAGVDARVPPDGLWCKCDMGRIKDEHLDPISSRARKRDSVLNSLFFIIESAQPPVNYRKQTEKTTRPHR